MTEQTTVIEWAEGLKKELERRTRRSDIEVTTAPYCSYDVLVSAAADKHPIVNFYAAIQGDNSRVEPALDYAAEMLQNWEITRIQHDKTKKDCLPFFEKLKGELPDILLDYTVFDFDKHFVQVAIVDENTVASCDLWLDMTEEDIKRLAFLMKDYQATLRRKKAACAGATYWWK